MNILLLGNDPSVDSEIYHLLENENYSVNLVTNQEDVWEKLELEDYHLLILSVKSRTFEAIGLCQQLREVNYTLPILLLTLGTLESDVIQALEAGIDDYVIKPFSPQEVLIRVRTLLHRSTQLPEILHWGGCLVNTRSCEVTYEGQLVTLTPKEYQLLELFIQHKNRIFSCRNILERLWSIEDEPLEDTVRAHIKGLRQKLKSAGAPDDLIETVYGLGYRLKSLSETSEKTGLGKTYENLIFQQLGEDLKQSLLGQWRILEQASLAFQEGNWNPMLRDRALSEVRTLVILLNTFGFVECCQIARQIETLLHSIHLLKSHEFKELMGLISVLSDKLQTIQIKHSPLLMLSQPIQGKRSHSSKKLGVFTEEATYPLSLQILTSYLKLGQQNQKPVSLVLFRYYPHYYPFQAEAIADLEDKIRFTFRSSDIITRWKPSEIVVGMYGANRENAKKRVNQVLNLVHSQGLTRELTVRLSFGIAQSPEDGWTLHSLYSAALINFNQRDLILN